MAGMWQLMRGVDSNELSFLISLALSAADADICDVQS